MKSEVKLCQVFVSFFSNYDTSRSEIRTPPLCIFNAVTVILIQESNRGFTFLKFTAIGKS
jgi:hypothetical protein